MRALRSIIGAHKRLLNPTSHSQPSVCRLSSVPRTKFLAAKISRHFQSNPEKFVHLNNIEAAAAAAAAGGPIGFTGSSSWSSTSNSNNEANPSVYTVYDPITSGLAAKRWPRSGDDQLDTSSSNGDANALDLSSLGYEDASQKDRVYGSVAAKASNAGQRPEYRDNYGGRNGKKKKKITFVCSDCGYSDGQWWGSCRSCNSVGTMKQFSERESGGGGRGTTGFEASENVVRSWLPSQLVEAFPQRLTDVNKGINHVDWRISLPGPFGSEVARVIGGGVVPGSLILVGGDPGVGKSTLLLQIAAMIAEGNDMDKPAPVVYVSGEESVEQIGNRADRMEIETEELFLYSSTDIEDILAKAQSLSPRALVVDSIQTVYLTGVAGSAGGLAQVKECTSALLRFAKKTNIPVLLTGHVTKSGDIAGPRVLEHIVDTVLYMEVGTLFLLSFLYLALLGEKYSSHRLLRPVKNRFGSTDEVLDDADTILGVFEMSQSGLQAVLNPSEMFLSENHMKSDVLTGLAVSVIMDGSRSFVIEIQALCAGGTSGPRQVNGVQASRADMIISVLMKQAGLKFQENGIFLNVVGGILLKETAGDLAVAAAICSRHAINSIAHLDHLLRFRGSLGILLHLLFFCPSDFLLEFPVPSGIAFIGEIGLGGELHTVPRMEMRVITVAKLGYRKCIVPKSAEKSLSGIDLHEMKIVGCQNLKEVIRTVFKPEREPKTSINAASWTSPRED
ncbi:hypothetical protein RJ640_008536 [Escallonia rubra]|uniref:RecA family profile 1 domain-containing protein n=1 Tax=Escallonia rubra TaxID=112253 RepID=A0AA88S7W7_9ASTE|nr:hypothetical protein RJ640_008536 [Escallonia rubra]